MGWEYCCCLHRMVHNSQGMLESIDSNRILGRMMVVQHLSNGVTWGNYEKGVRSCTIRT
jgi:hypothetical protein